ncbi:hypothetical protein ACGF8B_10795 [Streptomyces sp. NPDC047917]|uniref:hypothetical protein n=1 Tax=Streptomyces sp. NPDC047917 TaxID=3365491 RepID=UPI0037238610
MSLVLRRPGRIAWQDVPDPTVKDAAGAVIRVVGMPAAGRLPSSSLITHRFGLGQTEEAYDVLSRAADTGALQVTPEGPRHTAITAPAQP